MDWIKLITVVVLAVVPELINWGLTRVTSRGLRLQYRILLYAGALVVLYLLNGFLRGNWIGLHDLVEGFVAEALLFVAIGGLLFTRSSWSRPSPDELYHHGAGRRTRT